MHSVSPESLFYHINRWFFLLITTTFISYFLRLRIRLQIHSAYDCERHVTISNVFIQTLKEYVSTFSYFACLIFLVPLKSLSHLWRRQQCRWSIAHFDLCSALITIKQWCYCCVSYLLWHRTSVYNDHLRINGHTHSFCRVFGSGTVTTCFYAFVCRGWNSNTQPFAC